MLIVGIFWPVSPLSLAFFGLSIIINKLFDRFG